MQKSIAYFFNSKYGTVCIHLLFWAFFLFIPHILFNRTNHFIDTIFFGYQLIEASILAIVFYFNAYFFVPKFLMKRKYLIYFLIIIALFLLTSEIGPFTKPPKFPENQIAFQDNPLPPPMEGESRDFDKKKGPFLGFITLITIAISASYGYAYQYNKREKKLKELEKEQFASELLFLKSQINPHFLFNVLNSIYSLSLKKSNDLPEVIIKLSDLLRYVTYESEDKFVDITKELAYIQNYIDLQKLRLAKESEINFSITGDYTNVKIAPMLLITFIENAFKHGISSEGEIHMNCNIFINNSNIDFSIVNNVAKTHQKDSGNGIGIQNVKRRLELIYPYKHTLVIQELDFKYNVNLTINIS